MGSKITKKGGVKPKREVTSSRPKQATKNQKKIEQIEKEEELEIPSDSDSDEEEEEVHPELSSADDESDSELEEEGQQKELGGFSSGGEDSEEESTDDEDVKPTEPKKVVAKVETHEVKKLPKQENKKSKKDKKASKGVIYIGRLPEGFEEKELNSYFNQFGDITNVNLPRNKKSGRSKHFAFIEFSNIEDAKVAQDTMNNYLLLNHQLKVELVNDEFKNSKKFKKAYFKVSKLKKDVKALNDNVQSKREKRNQALKAAGIEF